MEHTDYEFELQKSRELRIQLKSNFYLKSEQANLQLDRFKGQVLEPVNFIVVSNLPINEWVVLSERVEFMRIPSVEGIVAIDLLMKEGSKIGWHYHADCTESITVLEGAFVDLISEKIYNKSATAFFEAKEPHFIVAVRDSILKIVLTKINKDD